MVRMVLYRRDATVHFQCRAGVTDFRSEKDVEQSRAGCPPLLTFRPGPFTKYTNSILEVRRSLFTMIITLREQRRKHQGTYRNCGCCCCCCRERQRYFTVVGLYPPSLSLVRLIRGDGGLPHSPSSTARPPARPSVCLSVCPPAGGWLSPVVQAACLAAVSSFP